MLAEDVELEGVGVLAAELEDVADLDGAVQLEAGAALRAGVALLDDDDVEYSSTSKSRPATTFLACVPSLLAPVIQAVPGATRGSAM